MKVKNSEKWHITIPEGKKIVSMSCNDPIFLQSNYTYNLIEHVKNLQNVIPLIKTDGTDSLSPNEVSLEIYEFKYQFQDEGPVNQKWKLMFG